jgi:hypothetical protein
VCEQETFRVLYQVVDIRRIILRIPFCWIGHVSGENRSFRLRFIVHGIETSQMVHEAKQIRMRRWIDGGIE